MDLTDQANMPYTYLERRSACSVLCSRGYSAADTGFRHQEPSHNRSQAVFRLIFGSASARLPCPQVPQSHPRVAKGASDRSSARQPCPQVLQSHPRVAKGASGSSLAQGPCPQVLQRHPGVAKGTSIDPLARGPSTEPLLGQGHVARLSGSGVKPVSCRCFGRTSARHPRREASRWHHGVAKQSSIGSSSIKCRYSMDIEVRIGFLSMKCRCFMDGCLGLDWVFA